MTLPVKELQFSFFLGLSGGMPPPNKIYNPKICNSPLWKPMQNPNLRACLLTKQKEVRGLRCGGSPLVTSFYWNLCPSLNASIIPVDASPFTFIWSQWLNTLFFRYDESLWHRVDMTKSNLLPGLLGKVLKRGTRVLRIAHAKVTAGVQVFMSMIFLQLHLMYSFSNILWTCCFRLFLINNILMSLLQVASPLCDDNAPFFLDVVPLSPKSPRLVFSRSTHM